MAFISTILSANEMPTITLNQNPISENAGYHKPDVK